MQRSIAAFLLVLAGSSPLSSGATEVTSLDLGSQQIVVPVPDGFAAMRGRSPTIGQIFQAQDSDFQLLEAYITQKDLADLIVGAPQSRDRGLTAEIAKNAIGRSISDEVFARLVVKAKAVYSISGNDSSQAIESLLSPGTRAHSGVADVDSAGTTEFTLTNFMDEAGAFGYTLGFVRLDGKKGVVARVLLHVQRRVLYIECTALLKNRADLDWAQGEVKQWAHSILSANSP